MITQIKRSYFNPTQTLTLISRCISAIGEDNRNALGLSTALNACTESMNALDESLSHTSASDYTQEVKELDNKCDDAYRFLRAISKAYKLSHKEEERQAANTLFAVLHKHIPSIEALGYVREMATLKALASELNKEKHLKAIQRLQLEEYVDYLAACRNDFEALYIKKNIAEADKGDRLKTSDAANKCIEALMAMIQIINAHLLLSPTPETEELATNFNSIIEAVSKASK